jgi:hypothetical protein
MNDKFPDNESLDPPDPNIRDVSVPDRSPFEPSPEPVPPPPPTRRVPLLCQQWLCIHALLTEQWHNCRRGEKRFSLLRTTNPTVWFTAAFGLLPVSLAPTLLAAPPDRSAELLALAKEHFGDRHTDADRNLFHHLANGWMADFSDDNPNRNDPAGAEEWGDHRVIRADRLRWLLTDPSAMQQISRHGGFGIKGARIDGALELYGATIDWLIAFESCRFSDEIQLADAEVGLLTMPGTHTKSILAPRLRVARGLFLRERFHADGEVNLEGATIGGGLACDAGTFSNPGGYALNAEGIKVDGHVFLREGFKAEGEVRLLGATIGGQLACDAGTFSNPDGYALNTQEIKVNGGVFLRKGFKAEGEVRLLGATIGGNLECDAGTFSNPSGYALSAQGIRVSGSVFLRDEFEADGAIDFTAAEVDGWFQWQNIRNPEKATLGLRGARVGTLFDEKKSWPKQLHLDGFVYDRIYHEAPTDAKTRLDWLALQPGDRYLPQPYNQLARVLHEMGHEQDARKIHYAKVNDPQRLADMTFWGWAWHHVLRYTIGNGYYPARALGYAVFFVLFGCLLFYFVDRNGGMIATGNSSDPPVAFNALVYSLDAFVPLIDLHQVKYAHPIRWEVRLYFWLHIAAGWSLTTLLVVGFTGLVRK